METEINSLIAIAQEQRRFNPTEYAIYRKRLCEKRGDDAGAALWFKVARLIAICRW